MRFMLAAKAPRMRDVWYEDGARRIAARAYDILGNFTERAFTVQVRNHGRRSAWTPRAPRTPAKLGTSFPARSPARWLSSRWRRAAARRTWTRAGVSTARPR